MASLRDMVSEYQDDLRNGIAWLAFWREGRSWQAEAFHLDLDDTLYPEDRARLAEIQAADPRAVVVNGYYSGYLGEEMNVAELAAGVRHHYDNGLNNIAPFMEAHSDELPPDVLEEAREKAHAAGLPFYERPYRGDDIDPYTYDGHMSMEDYELMQKLMEQDRERREPVSEVFSILLHNRQLYEQGKEGLWLSLPTTTEKLQAALREIGISTDNPQDFFIAGFSCPEDRHLAIPYDMVLAADVDELNFLAARLDTLDAAALAELNAALQNPRGGFESIGQIIDYADNVDYFVHLPDVQFPGQLGDYYLNRSGMVDMPEEWKAGIDVARFGQHIAQQEQGVFTPYGYLVRSGDEWQRVHEGQPVPEEYRVMSFSQPEVLREAVQTRQAAAPTAEAPAQPQVIPIILNSKNSADRMKEITDKLETGIMDLFESDRFQAYLDTMARFHNYSFNNTILIAMQGGQLDPEIVQATKEAALPVLLQREAKDNEIAAQKGLKPYTLLNVEFHDGADEQTGGYMGWYYVTLAVDGKICTHLETGLSYDIADGKVSDTPTRADYYPAGALKETDVDYVFNNVGFPLLIFQAQSCV